MDNKFIQQKFDRLIKAIKLNDFTKSGGIANKG